MLFRLDGVNHISYKTEVDTQTVIG